MNKNIINETNEYCYINDYITIIENGTIDEFINFAKNYNIFLPPKTSIYRNMVAKIKERLDKEGLPYDTVKPDQNINNT